MSTRHLSTLTQPTLEYDLIYLKTNTNLTRRSGVAKFLEWVVVSSFPVEVEDVGAVLTGFIDKEVSGFDFGVVKEGFRDGVKVFGTVLQDLDLSDSVIQDVPHSILKGRMMPWQYLSL